MSDIEHYVMHAYDENGNPLAYMTEPWKVHSALMAYCTVQQQTMHAWYAHSANKAWIKVNSKVDYEKYMLDEHGSYTTKDLYPLWKQISGMYQYASSHCFDYLLHTNAFTPRPKLSEANHRLVVAYANSKLDMHLDMFTCFMDTWLINFPNTHSWNVHGSSYCGCMAFIHMFNTCVMQYFVINNIDVSTYFFTHLQQVDFSRTQLPQVLNDLQLQYPLYTYVHGSITKHSYTIFANTLRQKMHQHVNTQEHVIANAFHTIMPDFKQGNETQPLYDAFLLFSA